MPYPSQSHVLSSEPLLDWIDRDFLRRDPFAFADNGFDATLRLVASEFDVAPNGIFCIGSGAIGLSINPAKIKDGKLSAFHEKSDLDLALISEVHFETAWRDLRAASQPTISEQDELLTKNLDWQKKQFFNGAIIANKLLPALSFGPEWIASLSRLSEHLVVLLGREIEVGFWIYRDYWSLRNYVANSIIQCRKKLT